MEVVDDDCFEGTQDVASRFQLTYSIAGESNPGKASQGRKPRKRRWGYAMGPDPAPAWMDLSRMAFNFDPSRAATSFHTNSKYFFLP